MQRILGMSSMVEVGLVSQAFKHDILTHMSHISSLTFNYATKRQVYSYIDIHILKVQMVKLRRLISRFDS